MNKQEMLRDLRSNPKGLELSSKLRDLRYSYDLAKIWSERSKTASLRQKHSERMVTIATKVTKLLGGNRELERARFLLEVEKEGFDMIIGRFM